MDVKGASLMLSLTSINTVCSLKSDCSKNKLWQKRRGAPPPPPPFSVPPLNLSLVCPANNRDLKLIHIFHFPPGS